MHWMCRPLIASHLYCVDHGVRLYDGAWWTIVVGFMLQAVAVLLQK
jgi:hypothetical protein